MQISRELAITILEYLHKNPDFYFPFLVVCCEYITEYDEFVEIEPEEWENIKNCETYQTFELLENLQNLYENTTELLAKWFIEKILEKQNKDKLQRIYEEIKRWFDGYDKLYKPILTESEDIETYGTNEFFWCKREAYEDMLEFMERLENKKA